MVWRTPFGDCTTSALLKYDSDSKGFRFGDVIDLVHPANNGPAQADLYKHALDRRHDWDEPIPERLTMLRARQELTALPVGERRAVLRTPERLRAVGVTWESLAGWLQQALTHSLANAPMLNGRTLILVDTSGSMNSRLSTRSELMRWDAAAVFGVALGQRCADAQVVSFASTSKEFPMKLGESLLRSVERWKSGGYFLNSGTDTAGAVRQHFRKHDRVVIVTDEQAAYGDVGTALLQEVPLYTWNLAGYRFGHAPSGSSNRHTFGGLTDAAFGMIPLLEAGKDADWPF